MKDFFLHTPKLFVFFFFFRKRRPPSRFDSFCASKNDAVALCRRRRRRRWYLFVETTPTPTKALNCVLLTIAFPFLSRFFFFFDDGRRGIFHRPHINPKQIKPQTSAFVSFLFLLLFSVSRVVLLSVSSHTFQSKTLRLRSKRRRKKSDDDDLTFSLLTTDLLLLVVLLRANLLDREFCCCLL